MPYFPFLLMITYQLVFLCVDVIFQGWMVHTVKLQKIDCIDCHTKIMWALYFFLSRRSIHTSHIYFSATLIALRCDQQLNRRNKHFLKKRLIILYCLGNYAQADNLWIFNSPRGNVMLYSYVPYAIFCVPCQVDPDFSFA